MRTKICTSIEQSKKLLELGIDVNTANMHYSTWTILNEGEYILSPNQGETIEELQEDYGNQIVPAWSLSALLGLIPTDDKKDEYYVDTESHSDYHTVSYRNCWDGCIHSEYSEESLLDAAFGMVVWLKENNKL